MTQIPQSAFPDPAQRQAAQFVVDHDAVGAIDMARRSPDGLNAIGPEGDTLLLLAIRGNDIKMVDALLAAGADPNIPKGRAPIGSAAELADTKISAALLHAGADPDAAVGGETALWRAALGGRFDLAEVLLKNGAAIDRPTSAGMTPAMGAIIAKRFRMAEFLMDRGASPLATSEDGDTLGFWAERSRVSGSSAESQSRDAVIARLKAVGFPWPPLKPAEVVAARANKKWPPS